jgi:broad specificity phosphatase PhoE
MSHLTLVRHGQAAFLSDDYDRLSSIGEAQARQLGNFWSARGVLFDEVYTGPRKRQICTAKYVGESYAEAGLAWPGPVVIEDLDEYDGDGILRELLPALTQSEARFKSLVENFEQASEPTERYKHFQKMFETVTALWMRGAAHSPRVEPWRDFHSRVRRAMERITEGVTGGKRIAVFTSGGPISIITQLAMRAPEEMAMELNWRIRNCSLTEIVFTKDRVTLDSFNGIPHLHDPSLWTYR